MPTRAERLTDVGALAKFTAAVALLAILADAAIGHALLWENDPYWTYWITKTFLIATVFGLGTAWLGVGIARGAVLTAVHTLILTIYYWTLSPIGLPSHPTWLDLEHTWVTGVPVHFGVIYLGYLGALWLLRRRGLTTLTQGPTGATGVARDALAALAVGAAIVVGGGLLEALAVGEFPGVTWFVVRLLVTVPFVLVWWAAAGRDRAAAVGGAITLALILATYGHFLGPVGLPDTDLRLLAQDPPPASVHWLSYRDEFLVALPITLLVAHVALLGASGRRAWRPVALRRSTVAAGAAAVVALVLLGAVTWTQTGSDADDAVVMSTGAARVERGDYYAGDLIDAEGDLRLVAENRNPRVTPLPPHDRVDLDATVTDPDGTTYRVQATRPMVDDPLGRFGTWWGVGFDEWHHGRSGVGTDLLPATRSVVAVFALGDVTADGETIATGVPIHVMTTDHADGHLELDVGDPAAPLPSLPDGHLRVVWDGYHGGHSHDAENARYTFGAAVLVALLALVIAAIRTERARQAASTGSSAAAHAP